MALFKKNALNQITFTLVDKTDFATIESAVTASDFDSQATKKGWGYNHGGSAATTSFTISKLTSLVRSGILRQTLKAAECNYDRVHYVFRGHASAADQHIIIDFADNDDSDIMSALTVIQSMASDAASAAAQANSRVLLNQSRISDAYSMLSDFYSDFQSRVPKGVATNSQLSDLHSDLRSFLVVMSGVQSDLYSLLSDMQSDFQSRVPKRVATDSQLSDVSSDLRSLIVAGVGLTTSALSDIASRVWSEKYHAHSLASSFGSLVSVMATNDAAAASRALLNQSRISDAQSMLSDFYSDFQSRVPKRVATDSQLSDLHSDLRSYLVGLSGTVSDIYSLASDLQSDFQSRVPKRVATDSQLSDLSSDLRSVLILNQSTVSDIYSGVQLLQSAFIGHTGSTASQVADASVLEIDGIDHDDQFNGYFIKVLGGSQVDELRLIVDTNKTTSTIIVKPAFNSRLASGVDFVIANGNPFQSRMHSDLRSVAVLNQSMISDIYSALSDFQSDFQSRVPKRVATDSQLSDLASDIKSAVANVSVTLTASDISDIASAVAAATTGVTASDISDIASAVRAILVSDLSDILSAAQQTNSRALVNQSRVSDIYSLLSDVQSDFQSRVPKRVATDSQLSDLASDIKSAVAAGAFTMSASDISDIASAVRAAVVSDLSDILSAAQQTNSRVLLNKSVISDIYSLLSDVQSDFQSRVPKRVATDSQLSDLASDLRSVLTSISAIASDAHSAAAQANSRALVNQSSVSDVYSLLSDLNSNIQSQLSSVQSDLDNLQTRTLTAATAAKLEKSAGTIVFGTVINAGFLPTTTEFEASDITEATADHYNGRIVIFTSGALANQATSISAYSLSVGRGHFTVVGMTEAPGNGDEFVIV